jgi:chitinase
MDPSADVQRLLDSPVFANFAFAEGNTQYADAMLRATFPKGQGHTLLGKPEIKPLTITVPVGYGYILTSKKSGGAMAVVDVEFMQKALFKQLPKQEGKLVLAVTHNTTYYSDEDATE